MKVKIWNDVAPVDETILLSDKLGREEAPFWRGVVFTREGIVSFHQQPSDPPATKFCFIWQGQYHMRAYGAFYSRRYTMTLARRFAEEIVGRERGQ